jgi:hypothetical protein
MKKSVLIYTAHLPVDEHYEHECNADATPDELYAAVYNLYPDWTRIEIVIAKQ